ncbi:hypothetical protein HNP84_000241 [Thermocatellispora tengchongensis]|uniref:Uncharacterized protein n=1 Tax=Thermocatellispora tengchongensis TaxID=1073253 RepID=A0A840NXY1_9ACTN|nr:hypothetical protein [Thermocatellispora tengchongensis]MBB5130553.1 hypothetical protein [Thermocatellispora tengchongensis]
MTAPHVEDDVRRRILAEYAVESPDLSGRPDPDSYEWIWWKVEEAHIRQERARAERRAQLWGGKPEYYT